MIKITIEADNDMELENRLRRAVNSDRYLSALNDVAAEVFRPVRKHGYSDNTIQDLVNLIDDIEIDGVDGLGSKLIGLLEEKFYTLIKENGVDIDE